jgi:hypothetical protein
MYTSPTRPDAKVLTDVAESVAEGIIGIQMGIIAAVRQDGLKMEQIQSFVQHTPGGKRGEALWDEFRRRRMQPNQKEDYDFTNFIREVITEAKTA